MTDNGAVGGPVGERPRPLMSVASALNAITQHFEAVCGGFNIREADISRRDVVPVRERYNGGLCK